MSAEFTTQTGCRVRMRPAPALGPGTVILSLRVEHPHSVGYVGTEDDRTTIQYAEVAFTEQERAALAEALTGADRLTPDGSLTVRGTMTLEDGTTVGLMASSDGANMAWGAPREAAARTVDVRSALVRALSEEADRG